MNPTDLPSQFTVPKYEGNKQRILELLGSGIKPAFVSQAVGVDESYISQLLSNDEFAQAVMQLRFDRLQAASNLDTKYEKLEAELVQKLEDCLWAMNDPLKLLAAIRVINGTKRRGAEFVPSTVVNQTVNLVMPEKILQKFRVNEANQVVEVDGQRMTTINAKTLMNQIEGPKSEALDGNAEARGTQTYLPSRRIA